MYKYISRFEQYQQKIITILVDLNLAKDFENVDTRVTDIMEEMGSQTYHTVSLIKIKLPKFAGNVAYSVICFSHLYTIIT